MSILYSHMTAEEVDNAYWGGDRNIPLPRPSYQINDTRYSLTVYFIESFVNIVLVLEQMPLQEPLQLSPPVLIFMPTASSRTLTLAQLHSKTQHTPQPFSNMPNNFSPLPLAPLVDMQYTNIPCLR